MPILASLCLNHCSRFYEDATDFSIPKFCSDMEGHDINIRSGRH
jgi:hypothetical protein